MKFVELDARDFIPAGGQGALAIETLADRKGDELDRALAAINDARAFYETAAERAFLAAIEASCTTPVGVQGENRRRYAGARGDAVQSRRCARVDRIRSNEPLAADLAPAAAEDSGKRLAEKMLARGAAALLGK